MEARNHCRTPEIFCVRSRVATPRYSRRSWWGTRDIRTSLGICSSGTRGCRGAPLLATRTRGRSSAFRRRTISTWVVMSNVRCAAPPAHPAPGSRPLVPEPITPGGVCSRAAKRVNATLRPPPFTFAVVFTMTRLAVNPPPRTALRARRSPSRCVPPASRFPVPRSLDSSGRRKIPPSPRFLGVARDEQRRAHPHTRPTRG